MTTTTLLRRNLAHYWRTNLAVVGGVTIAVAVLAGALLVGDSVRASLRDLVESRLGRTDTVVSAASFFHEGLAGDACPLIVLEGLVTAEKDGRRESHVQVYGIDERFWKFHGRSDRALANRDALLSEGLASELASGAGDTILVRIEKPSAIPKESLHGRKDDAARTLRFFAAAVLDSAHLGEFSLRPQQGAVRAIFLPLPRLQKDLAQTGKVNTLLFASPVDPTAFHAKVTLDDLGVKLRELSGDLSVESDSAVLSDPLATAALATAKRLGLRAMPILTYLANSIRIGQREIPYSIVTAVGDEPLALNEWAAHELNAKVGDEIALDYYLWGDGGSLLTRTAHFQVGRIVPIRGFAADRNLAPEYPGITAANSLSDWDPPFPIDLKRVRPSDEAYWKTYRTTPKLFIPLVEGQKLWGTRFGKLTSIRVSPPAANYGAELRKALDPAQLGFAIFPARQQGRDAAQGSTDFGEYYLYFSFFLMASALLLAGLFFRLGVEQRLREIGTLRAFGFSARKIRNLFLAEACALSVAGSALGLGGAVLYCALIMFGLRTWWKGAVGTSLLTLHVAPAALLYGAAGGVGAALLCIVITLRGLRRISPRAMLSGAGLQPSVRTAGKLAQWFAALAALSGFACLASSKQIGQVPAFFGAGVLFLVAALCAERIWLVGSASVVATRSLLLLGFRGATHRPGRSILSISLVAFATFVIVSVDAFHRDPESAIKGFPLVAESLLPIYHDPNTPAGRESLNMTTDAAKFYSFRLRPGDDSSCLNLYQPRNPRILGAPASFLAAGRFTFQDSTTGQNPWLFLDRDSGDGTVPAIADANSLTYSLHKKVGDELVIDSGSRPIRLRLVAALDDSILQSEIVISEKNFIRLFPDEQGYRFFLLDVPAGQVSAVTAELERSLSDYGFDVSSTAERLAGYHRVENTYLSTFQSLGALGLLLGTAGLAAVLLRNALERRRELAMLRAVGYRRAHLIRLILAENALLLVSGVTTGALCALLAIVPAILSRGGHLPALWLGSLLLGVLFTGFAASLVAAFAAVRGPLLSALRSE